MGGQQVSHSGELAPASWNVLGLLGEGSTPSLVFFLQSSRGCPWERGSCGQPSPRPAPCPFSGRRMVSSKRTGHPRQEHPRCLPHRLHLSDRHTDVLWRPQNFSVAITGLQGGLRTL